MPWAMGNEQARASTEQMGSAQLQKTGTQPSLCPIQASRTEHDSGNWMQEPSHALAEERQHDERGANNNKSRINSGIPRYSDSNQPRLSDSLGPSDAMAVHSLGALIHNLKAVDGLKASSTISPEKLGTRAYIAHTCSVCRLWAGAFWNLTSVRSFFLFFLMWGGLAGISVSVAFRLRGQAQQTTVLRMQSQAETTGNLLATKLQDPMRIAYSIAFFVNNVQCSAFPVLGSKIAAASLVIGKASFVNISSVNVELATKELEQISRIATEETILSVQLAARGVVTVVHPTSGNEEALGMCVGPQLGRVSDERMNKLLVILSNKIGF